MSDSGTAQKTRLREQIAEEIGSLLGRRRLRDIDLARKLGRSHTYVYRRLNGETAFDADDLEAIAELLGVNVVDLLPKGQRHITAEYPIGLLPFDPPPPPPAERIASTPLPTLAGAIATPLPGGPLPSQPVDATPPPGRRRTAPVPAAGI